MRIHPFTSAEVIGMHERALSQRSPESLAQTGADLGALAAAAALQNKANGTLDQLGLGNSARLELITNPNTRASFESALGASERLFERLGVTPPSAEELAAAGIDLMHLASEFERMDQEGLEPQLVLAPHGLGLEVWKELYSSLRSDGTIPGNPLKHLVSGDRLFVADVVQSAWISLDNPKQLPTATPTCKDSNGTSWSLRLVPGTATTKTNISYKDHAAAGGTNPTTPEYLTLQAVRIQDGDTPLDTNTWSWLEGTFQGGARAPFGTRNSGSGRVIVDSLDAGASRGRLGVRSPLG